MLTSFRVEHRSVLAKHYTGRDFDMLRNLYNRIDLKVLTPTTPVFSNMVNDVIQAPLQVELS